ncbi:isochorismate synthase [Mariniphaga sediminis]|uniref:Isochorismate synthase n=1 Tax=Mariniphaga sediminis TaxID=1628158 RepID=A0A399CVU6_9BACT|nr:chorismate-binding protein [Mariniphaga sediminis]RIH63346.1 isochorismate synthase [Mariniphaga sediminis]
MTDTKDFALFIDGLLAKNCPFAIWSVPGSNTPEILIAEKEGVIHLKEFNKLNGEEGFVFAPYQITEHSPLVLLKPGIYKKGLSEILKIDCHSIPEEPVKEVVPEEPFIISKDEYLKDIEDTIDVIKNTKLAKVIVSRLLPYNRTSESIGEIYLQLFQQTPNAFVYLVNLPANGQGQAKAGLWMGATPEVLLKSEGKMLETVSLAGTQLRRPVDDYSWYTKEIEEQAFVSRYLLDVFYRFNIHPYTTQGPETLESGKVAHLATSFRFAAKKLASNLGDFVAELHPTPAVCGYPKLKAAKFITKIEKHDRRYYTGYLGPWRLNGDVGLFVNLRCMEIMPEQYILYSGGGITSRSVPEDEWEEINKKATTLLSAIEAVQNR